MLLIIFQAQETISAFPHIFYMTTPSNSILLKRIADQVMRQLQTVVLAIII